MTQGEGAMERNDKMSAFRRLHTIIDRIEDEMRRLNCRGKGRQLVEASGKEVE